MRARRGARTAALAACLALAGCYNDLDWREVPSTQGRYRIALPAKPFEQTRTLNSAAGAVSMTMVSAPAADWLFGVAWTDYPAGSDMRKNIDEQRDALLRNISGRTISENAGTSGRMLTAEGRSGEVIVALRARFVADGRRVYQIAAVGPKGGVPETELDTFFGSFKLQN
jgi:glucose/arabinose dehydrogenase